MIPISERKVDPSIPERGPDRRDEREESWHRLRLITDALPAVVAYIDRGLRFRFLNRAADDWFGVSRETVLGQTMVEALGEEGFRRLENQVGRVLLGETVHWENPMLYKTGVTRHVSGSYIPDLDEQGRVKGFVALVFDNSKQKAQQLALMESEQRFRFLAEAGVVLSSSLDYRSTLTGVARLAVPKLADWCAVDLLGRSCEAELVAVAHSDPRKVERAFELRRKFPIRVGDPKGLGNVLKTGVSELRSEVSEESLLRQAQNAEHLQLLLGLDIGSIMIVPLKALGRTLGGLTFISSRAGKRFDSTDLVVAEELARRAALAIHNSNLYAEVQSQRERLDLAQRGARVGTFDWDISTGAITWTEELEELYGFEPGAYHGTLEHWASRIHPEDLMAWKRSIRSAAQEKADFNLEYRVALPDGGIRWMLCRARLTRAADGQPLRMLGLNIDVTDRKQVEAERDQLIGKLTEAVRARDEFLSICSHELKTPVTSMKLQTQIAARKIERGDDDAFSEERFSRMVGSTDRQLDRLIRLIDDMLDVARIATGKLAMDLEGECDFSQMVREVAERFSEHLRGKIHLDIQSDLKVRGDRFRLEQVVANLLTNGIKYGKGTPVEVRVEGSPHPGFVHLTVEDRGPGISEDARERIFQRFERAVDSSSISGLGLGLYISRQIVEAHGGRIWVDGSYHPGARFVVELRAH